MNTEDDSAQGQEGDDNAMEDHPGQKEPNVILDDGDHHQQVRQEHEWDGEEDHLDYS